MKYLIMQSYLTKAGNTRVSYLYEAFGVVQHDPNAFVVAWTESVHYFI